MWIANETRYERHTLYSISADPMADSDRLRVILNVVSDWRDTQSGRTTGFECNERDQMGFFIGIQHPQTASITDCVEYNDTDNLMAEPTLDLWNHVPLPDCPLEPDSTSD